MVNRRVGDLRKDDRSGSGKRGRGFTYRPPSVDFVKRQSERKGGKFDNIVKGTFDMWRPKEGSNQIRIMPATWDDHDDYALIVWVHKRIGADTSTYLCLRKMLNKRCPICEECTAARKAGENDEAKALDCSEQMLCWMIDREEDRPKPKVYVMSAPFYKDVNALCYDTRTGSAIFVDNPDEGFDLKIKRTGQGLKTRYLPQIDHNPSPLADRPKDQDALIAFTEENPLPDVLNYYSAAYLEKILSGTGGEKDEDLDAPDEEDAAPRGRAKVGAKRRTEPEDEDLPDEEDAEQEEAPPRARARTRRAEPEEEDHEQDAADEAENEGREARQSMRGGTRRRAEPEDDAEEAPPRRSTARRRDPEEDPEEDSPPPKKRPQARARAEEADEEPEDEAPPRRKRAPVDDPEDDPPPRRRATARREEPEDEDAEEEAPPRRRAAAGRR